MSNSGLSPNFTTGNATDQRSSSLHALLLLFALVAVVRAVCFPFTWEAGDAPARIALAARWLREPTMMTTLDCAQFGPLSILFNAAMLQIWSDPYTSPRLLSLMLGIATAAPMFLLTRLLFGYRAAVFASVFFAFYSLHVKASGTAMAEAPFCLLMLMCAFFFSRHAREGRTGDLILSSLILTTASMVRYEAWLYIPLMALTIALRFRGSGAWREALGSAGICLILASIAPVFWTLVNGWKHGDAFWAWRFVSADHARTVMDVVSKRGILGLIAYNAFFLPGVLLLALSPGVAVLAVKGLWSAIRQRETLFYAALLLPFVSYYGLTVCLRMAPLARLYTLCGLLLIPYAGAQMDELTRALPARQYWRRTASVLGLMGGTFIALAIAPFVPNLPWQSKLWSVSPVSPFLPEEKTVYDLIKGRMKPGDKLVQDGQSVYSHIITFNLSPAICENWWDRPTIESLPSPAARKKFLRSSAPGFAVFETRRTDLTRLLDTPAEALYRLPEVGIIEIYRSPRYTVYELVKRQSSP